MGRIHVVSAPTAEEVAPTVEGFLRDLGSPALLRLSGSDGSRVRAVATLLHGNEPSGIRAVHRWLRSGTVPATDTVIFVGAVEAALEPPGFRHRALPGTRDLNRCFAPPCEGEEPELAREALELLRTRRPEALVDIHNTSGVTPPFGLGPALDALHLGIVGCFCRHYLWSDLQIGTLVEATHGDFPSAVVECGRCIDPYSDEVAYRGLCRFLSREFPPAEPPALRVYHRPARICMLPGVRLAFGTRPEPNAELTLLPGLDRFNLGCFPEGEPLGWAPHGWPLVAVGAEGKDLSRELFAIRGDVLEIRRPFIPAMATRDLEAASGDCLFYAIFPREG
jgi:hypothetical protein